MSLYDEILNKLPDRPPTLQSAYQATKDQSPAKAAQVYQLSQQTALPEPLVDKYYDKIQKMAETPSLQYWKQYEQFYPNTAKYLSDPKKMATAKDLLDGLGQEETIFTQAKTGYRKGRLNVELSELSWQQMLETLTTGKRSLTNEEKIREIETEMGQIAEPTGFKPVRHAAEQLPNMVAMAKNAGFKGAAAGMIAGLGAAIMGQVGPQVAIPEEAVTVPAAFTAGLKLGGGFGAAEQAAILEGGSAYREFIQLTDVTGQPIDPQLAAVAALAVGVINAGLESFSLSKLLQTIPGGEKVTQFLAQEGVKKVLKEQTTKGAVLEGLKRYLTAIGSEMATEFVQETVTQLGGEAIKTSGDFERKSFGEIVTDSAQVLSPTAQSTMLFGLPGFGTHIYQGMRNVQQAHIDAQTYEVLGQVAEQSEYLERLPEGWRTLAEMNTKDGALENIYIDTEQFTTLLQDATGLQGEEALSLVAKELGIEDQVQEVLDTNKPLSIPYAVWLEKVVKTPLYQAMQPHIKFSEDGITLSQAEAVEQRTNELIQQEQQRAEVFITRSEAFKQGYDEVYADVKQKLIEAGRPEKIKEREWNSYVDKAAKLWAAHAVVEASKRDITPQEWYKGANKPEILSAGEAAETVATAKEVIELPPQAPAAKISALAHPVNRMTMDERKYEELSDPKIMSYQFLHPELAEYIRSMAIYILGEVNNSIKGERFYTEYEGDLIITGTSKYVSETVQRIQDETGATYAEITQALQDIIEGKGAENTALAKKIELILDDNLTEGYTTFEGIDIPPDMDYILAKKQVEQKLKKQSTYSQDSLAPQTLDEFKAKWEASDVSFHVYEKKDTVVLSKLIVPEEQRNQGIGTQFMSDLIAYADRNNKTIALTPSSDFGGNINQLKKFYKRLGFVENKGKNRDFEISEDMYRTPATYAEISRSEGVTGTQEAVQGKEQAFYQNVLENPEFKEWFGDSKVVDEQGKPLVVYHNTTEQFSTFDITRARQGVEIPGFFFSDDPTSWADMGEHQIQAYLSIKNPFTGDYSNYKGIKGGTSFSAYQKIREALIKDGYDGIITKEEGGDGEYIAFFPEQIKSIHNLGTFNPQDPNIYHQNLKDPRAQVRITPERSIITLFATADASSFIHESAHIWLNDIFQYAKEGTLNEQYQEEWNTLTEWLGIAPDQEQLTTEQHEQFARSFERYLMEAKAPSRRLRQVFAAFRRWLTRIYRDAAALDVEMSDEVRGIMDRLLATEEEIREAALYDGFAELGEQARLAAEERLLVELMSELSPERKKALEKERQSAEDAARRELANDPLYKTIKQIKGAYKLNTDALRETYGNTILRRLPKELHSNEGTYTADIVADIFGFTSGDELIKKIVTSPSLEQAIQQRVELALTKHASMMITGQVKNVARQSLRNEYALELIALEKATLESMLSGEENINKNREIAKITAKAARRYAKGILASKHYKKATAAVSYFAAERDAAVKAERARKNNKLDLAAQYTNQRMLNHALAIEALNNKKEIDKMFRFFKRVAKEPKKRPSVPLEYRRQMYSLLERFMLKPGQANMTHPDRTSLLEFVTKKNEEYHNLPIPERLLNEQYIKDYKSMTLEELREVYAGVKILDKLGRYENRFYSASIKAELNEAAKETAESIKQNAGEKYAGEKNIGSYKTFFQKVMSIPDDINAWLLKTEFIVRYLDGNTEGPMHKYFWNLFNNAFNDEKQLEQRVIRRIRNVIGQFYNEQEMAAMSHTQIYIPALERSLTKEEIILCALNMGNKGNLDRLQRGYNLSDEQIAQIKAQLTKKDWDMVQAIWDYLDSFWPAIKKLEEEVTGIEPEQVEPLPVETPFGTYRGGYFPIKYDPGKSAEAFRHEEQLNALYKESPAAYAATRHGHTKQRARSVARPLNLRWNTLTSHLVNVIHDLTHRKAIIDANRFLKHKEVRQAIENAIGVKGYRALEKSVISIASDQGESMNFGDKAFRWLRSRTTLRLMGLNLRVALLQTSGFFHTMDEIGFIPTMRGMMTAMSNPQGTWNFVKERSAFMRDRALTFDRDIYDMSRRMFKNDKGLQNFAFSMIGFMDMVVSVPTWVEAYKIGLSKFQDETQAVEYADGVIRRTQGTGAIKDLAFAQRGNEMKRIITMFYSFGNVLYNRFWLAKKTAERQWTVGERQQAVQTIARATFYNWMLPGMFEFILREALRNEDNDDLDEILKRFGISMVSWPLQAAPIIRDIGQYLIDKAFGMYSTFRVSPIESTVESMGKVVDKARKIIQGNGEWLDLAEGIGEAAGFYKGVPQQVNTWVFNFLDWIEDNGEASWRDLFTRRRN